MAALTTSTAGSSSARQQPQKQQQTRPKTAEQPNRTEQAPNTSQGSPGHDADSHRNQKQYINDAQILHSSPKSPKYTTDQQKESSLKDTTKKDKGLISRDCNQNDSNQSKENNLPITNKNIASNSSKTLKGKSISNGGKHSSHGSHSQAKPGSRRSGMRGCDLCLKQSSQPSPQFEAVVLLRRLEEGLSQGDKASLKKGGMLQLVTSECQSKNADSKDSEFEESANNSSNYINKGKENVKSFSQIIDGTPLVSQLDGHQLVNPAHNEINKKNHTAVDHDIKSVTPVLSELPSATHLHSQHTLVSSPDSIGYNSPEKSKHETSSQFVSSTSQVSSSSKTEATTKPPLTSQQVIESTKEAKCEKDLDKLMTCNDTNLKNVTDKCSLVTNLVAEDSKLPVKSRIKRVSVSEKSFNLIFESGNLSGLKRDSTNDLPYEASGTALTPSQRKSSHSFSKDLSKNVTELSKSTAGTSEVSISKYAKKIIPDSIAQKTGTFVTKDNENLPSNRTKKDKSPTDERISENYIRSSHSDKLTKNDDHSISTSHRISSYTDTDVADTTKTQISTTEVSSISSKNPDKTIKISESPSSNPKQPSLKLPSQITESTSYPISKNAKDSISFEDIGLNNCDTNEKTVTLENKKSVTSKNECIERKMVSNSSKNRPESCITNIGNIQDTESTHLPSSKYSDSKHSKQLDQNDPENKMSTHESSKNCQGNYSKEHSKSYNSTKDIGIDQSSKDSLNIDKLKSSNTVPETIKSDESIHHKDHSSSEKPEKCYDFKQDTTILEESINICKDTGSDENKPLTESKGECSIATKELQKTLQASGDKNIDICKDTDPDENKPITDNERKCLIETKGQQKLSKSILKGSTKQTVNMENPKETDTNKNKFITASKEKCSIASSEHQKSSLASAKGIKTPAGNKDYCKDANTEKDKSITDSKEKCSMVSKGQQKSSQSSAKCITTPTEKMGDSKDTDSSESISITESNQSCSIVIEGQKKSSKLSVKGKKTPAENINDCKDNFSIEDKSTFTKEESSIATKGQQKSSQESVKCNKTPAENIDNCKDTDTSNNKSTTDSEENCSKETKKQQKLSQLSVKDNKTKDENKDDFKDSDLEFDKSTADSKENCSLTTKEQQKSSQSSEKDNKTKPENKDDYKVSDTDNNKSTSESKENCSLTTKEQQKSSQSSEKDDKTKVENKDDYKDNNTDKYESINVSKENCSIITKEKHKSSKSSVKSYKTQTENIENLKDTDSAKSKSIVTNKEKWSNAFKGNLKSPQASSKVIKTPSKHKEDFKDTKCSNSIPITDSKKERSTLIKGQKKSSQASLEDSKTSAETRENLKGILFDESKSITEIKEEGSIATKGQQKSSQASAEGSKSPAETREILKAIVIDKSKSITKNKETSSIAAKGKNKSLQTSSLGNDAHPSELPIERKNAEKPQSCLLEKQKKSNYDSNLSSDATSCKPRCDSKNLHPTSGSPKKELLQQQDKTLDILSPKTHFECNSESACSDSPQMDPINIALSEGSASDFEYFSAFLSTLNSNAHTDDENLEVNQNERTQECEVVQSSTSSTESNKGLKLRIKTKLMPSSLPNGEIQENNESAIPKLVLTWKGNGTKKEYSLTNKVKGSDDVDSLDISCKKQKTKKEKKHKIKNKEKTKKRGKVTKSKRHLELFGEDSNDSCDSSFKSDFSSKSDSVLEKTVIPAHDSQSSVNLPLLGESPQHSGSNSPKLRCRNSYEFSENVVKVCERLQTKSPTDFSDDSFSDSLPDIEHPMLVDNKISENKSQISMTEKIRDRKSISDDQQEKLVVDEEASENIDVVSVKKSKEDIDKKSSKRDCPDLLKKTTPQKKSSELQRKNTSTPIMIGGKPTATVEPYCRDNKRKIENISSQIPKLELISEECMFSKSVNKEIIFGRSNRSDHNLLQGENQRVQVVPPTKISFQKQESDKKPAIPPLSPLPTECDSESDEKDYKSYKTVNNESNIYKKLSYDMLYSRSRCEKDDFVVNFLKDTKFNKNSTIFNNSYINRKNMSSQPDDILRSHSSDNLTSENLYSGVRPKSCPSALLYSPDKITDIKYSTFFSKDDIFMNNEPRGYKKFDDTLPKSSNSSKIKSNTKYEPSSSELENINTSSASAKEIETSEEDVVEEVHKEVVNEEVHKGVILEEEQEEMHETQLTIDEDFHEPENKESDGDDQYQSITIFSDLTKEDEEYKKKNIFKSRYTSEIAKKYSSKDKDESNNSNNNNDDSNSNNNNSEETESTTNLETNFDPEFEKVWGERARKCQQKKLKRLQLKKNQKHGNQESKDDISPISITPPISPHPPPIPDMTQSPTSEIPSEKVTACENNQDESEKKSKNEKEKKPKEDCEKKKRIKKKKEITESDSDTDSCIEGGSDAKTQAKTVVLEEERDRRLAQEIPGFNWLEQKIKNGAISKPNKNSSSVKSSNNAKSCNLKKDPVSTRNIASNMMCQQGMPIITQAENSEEIRRHPYGGSPSMGVRTHLQTAVPIVPPSRVTALPKRRMSTSTSSFQQPGPPTSSNVLPNVMMSSLPSTAATVSDTNSNPVYSSQKSYQANQQMLSQDQSQNYIQYSYQPPQMSLHPDKQHIPPHMQQSSMQQEHIPQIHNQMLMTPISQQKQPQFQQSAQHCAPPKLYHGNQDNIHDHSRISGEQQDSFPHQNLLSHYEQQTLIPEKEVSRNSCSYQQEYNPLTNSQKYFQRQQSMPSLPDSQKSYQRQQSLPYQMSSQQFPNQQHSTFHTKEDSKSLKQEGDLTHKRSSEFPACQGKGDENDQKPPINPIHLVRDTHLPASNDSHVPNIKVIKHESTSDLQENSRKFSRLVEAEHDMNLKNIKEKKEHNQKQGINSSGELKVQSDDSNGPLKTEKEKSETPNLPPEPQIEISDTLKDPSNTLKGTSDRPTKSIHSSHQVDQPNLSRDQLSSETHKKDSASNLPITIPGKDKPSSSTSGVAFSPKLNLLKRAFSDMLKSEPKSDGLELPAPKKTHLDTSSESIDKSACTGISSTSAETVVRSSVITSPINYIKNESSKERKFVSDNAAIVERKDSPHLFTDKEVAMKVNSPVDVDIKPKLTPDSSEKEDSQPKNVDLSESSSNVSMSMLLDELRRTKEEMAKLKERFLTEDKNTKEGTQVKENSNKVENPEDCNRSQSKDNNKAEISEDEVLIVKSDPDISDPDIIIEGEFDSNKHAKISIRNDLIQGSSLMISDKEMLVKEMNSLKSDELVKEMNKLKSEELVKDNLVKDMNRLKSLFGITNSEVEVMPIAVPQNKVTTQDSLRINNADNLKQNSPSPNLKSKIIKGLQGNNDNDIMRTSSHRFDRQHSEVDITLTSNIPPNMIQTSSASRQPSPLSLQPSPQRMQPSPHRPLSSPQRFGPSPSRQQPSPHRSQISPHSENIWNDCLKQPKPHMVHEQEPKRPRYSTSDLPDHLLLSQKSITPPMKPSSTIIRRHSDTAEIFPVDSHTMKAPKVHPTSYPITLPTSTQLLDVTRMSTLPTSTQLLDASRMSHEIHHSNNSTTDQSSRLSHNCIHGRKSYECRDCLMRTVADMSGSQVHSFGPDKAKIFPVSAQPPLHVHSYKSTSPVSTMSHSSQESYNRALIDSSASSINKNLYRYHQQIYSNPHNTYGTDLRKPVNEIPTREISTDLSKNRVMPPEHQRVMPTEHQRAMPPDHRVMPAEHQRVMPPGHQRVIMPPEHQRVMPPEHQQVIPSEHQRVMPPEHQRVMPPEHNHQRGTFGPHFQGFNSVNDKGAHSYQETPHSQIQAIRNPGPQTFAPRVLVHSGRPPIREAVSNPNIHRYPTAPRHIYPGNPYHPHNPRLQFPGQPPGHFMGGQIPPSHLSHPRLPQAPSMVAKPPADPGPSASADNGNVKREGKSGGISERKTCFNCTQQAKFLCSGCKKAWYCSEECQRRHWVAHNVSCVP